MPKIGLTPITLKNNRQVSIFSIGLTSFNCRGIKTVTTIRKLEEIRKRVNILYKWRGSH